MVCEGLRDHYSPVAVAGCKATTNVCCLPLRDSLPSASLTLSTSGDPGVQLTWGQRTALSSVANLAHFIVWVCFIRLLPQLI